MAGAGGVAATLGPAVVVAAARGAVLLAAAWLAVRLLRRRSASLRHAVWAAALGAHLVLPVLSGVLPGWRVPITARTPAVPRTAISGLARVASKWSPGESGSTARRSWSRAGADPVAGGWTTPWIAVWAAGVGLLLLRRAAAGRALRRIVREAHPLTDAGWRDVARAAAADLGLRRPVTLLRGAARTVPVTWGARRPVVLLPSDADAWSDARRRLVLLHELAHAARGDVLVLHLTQLVTAAFWFDPLVWLAARRLAAEAERAADDAVLRAGVAPSAYVAELVEIVRTRRTPPAFALALAAGRDRGRQSAFERRMRGVLDARADRRALGGRAAALLAAGTLACAAPMASARHIGRRVAPLPAAPGPTARPSAPALTTTTSPRTPAHQVRTAGRPASRDPASGRAAEAAPPATIAPEPRSMAERLGAGDPTPAPAPTARLEVLAHRGAGYVVAGAQGEGSTPMPVAVPVEVPVEVPVAAPPAARGAALPPVRIDVRVDVGVSPLR